MLPPSQAVISKCPHLPYRRPVIPEIKTCASISQDPGPCLFTEIPIPIPCWYRSICALMEMTARVLPAGGTSPCRVLGARNREQLQGYYAKPTVS